MDKKTFFKLLFSSVKMLNSKYPDSIFYCYNKNIERQLKYNNLLNINKPINYKINSNDIMFEQDIRNKKLWVDHYKIWDKLLDNPEYKEIGIYDLIDGWLKDESNWKDYTSFSGPIPNISGLNDESNWNKYSTRCGFYNQMIRYKNETNWKHYSAAHKKSMKTMKRI